MHYPITSVQRKSKQKAGDTQYKNRVSPAYNYITAFIFLVMEQPDSGKCHRHVVFVAGINYIVITD